MFKTLQNISREDHVGDVMRGRCVQWQVVELTWAGSLIQAFYNSQEGWWSFLGSVL